ncbi:MAG: hypothetical protein R3B54_02850 [Bdellovibrionota bacterium]
MRFFIQLTLLIVLADSATASIVVGASSFFEICMSPKRPAGFDRLVKDHLEWLPENPVKFEDYEACESHWKRLKSRSGIVFNSEEQLKLLRLFPDLTGYSFEIDGKLLRLTAPPHDGIQTYMVIGDLCLTDLRPLKIYSQMHTLGLSGGSSKTAWVDLRHIAELSSIKNLTLYNVKLFNAKELEKMKGLVSIGMKKVTTDKPVDWSALPGLKVKDIR